MTDQSHSVKLFIEVDHFIKLLFFSMKLLQIWVSQFRIEICHFEKDCGAILSASVQPTDHISGKGANDYTVTRICCWELLTQKMDTPSRIVLRECKKTHFFQRIQRSSGLSFQLV